MNKEKPFVTAVVCDEGRFSFTGSSEAALKLKEADSLLIDLEGAAVYPGFHDSHLHILNKAVTGRELELNSAESCSDMLRMVAEAASKPDSPGFINGRGFNEDLWDEAVLPSKAELDRVSNGKPVMLTRVCGHKVLVNSKAIEMSGVTAETPQIPGGSFDFETGIFAENAIGLIASDCGDKGVDACCALLYEGLCHAADNGLTCLHTDDLGTYGFSAETVVSAYRRLEAEGRMPVRVIEQCALPDSESFERFGLPYMHGSDIFRIGPRKLYIDGSLGARTALLSVPYADDENAQGVAIYTQDELNRLAKESHMKGTPFICHAIGDLGCRMVLDAIEYARSEVPGTDSLPDGIVHCQITGRDELKRIRKLNAVVYAQPVFTEYDLHICAARAGKELEKTSYNWKTLYDMGVTICSGSDCPVEPLSPAMNIFCAVTRKDFGLFPEGGWMPDQRLSVYEAIACHTVNAAKAVGLQDRLGIIAEGYLADMTVYAERLEEADPDSIKDMKPLMTVVNGKARLYS